MKLRRFWQALRCVLFLASGPVALVGQEAQAKNDALDGLERSWVDLAVVAEQIGSDACQQLEPVKRFNRVLDETIKQIEARHPGYTLDYRARALVKKK